MPAISGHNSRVLVFPHELAQNQGSEDLGTGKPYALMANRWQFSYKTELIETTSYENPRAPLVTPLSSRVAGLTDIDFNFEAYWDTTEEYAHPFGWPDLRPGTRPAICLEIKKYLNMTGNGQGSDQGLQTAPTPGLDTAAQPFGFAGTGNAHAQYFYFIALITECQINTEVKGVVTYTVSGKATPYVDINNSTGTHTLRTGAFLPLPGNGGMAFSSQDYFWHNVRGPGGV